MGGTELIHQPGRQIERTLRYAGAFFLAPGMLIALPVTAWGLVRFYRHLN